MTQVPPPFSSDLAPQLAAVASQVPGVAHLDGGRFGENSTYLPTGIVKGVALDNTTNHVRISLAATWPHHLLRVADAVRDALAVHVDSLVDVNITDLVIPDADTNL